MRLFEIGVNFSFFPRSCSTANNREEKGFENNKLYQCLSPPCPLCLASFTPFLPPPRFLSLSHTLTPSPSLFSPVSPFLPPLERQGNETAREQRKVSAEHQLCMEEVKIYCKWDDASKFIFIQITVIIHYSFPCKHLASVFVMRCHYLPDYVIKLLTRQARRATIQGHA